jgi:glutathione S-transferase
MKLFYSVSSPYSRKVLLLAKSLGMGNDIDLIMANPLENGPDLLKVNPLNKVPALVQGGKTYFDSPLIAEHLLALAGQDRMSDKYMARLGVQALADGIMDAAVAIRMESLRSDAEQSKMWLKRWYSAINRSLDLLENSVIAGLSGWKLDSISVACALDYLAFRHADINWDISHPKCANWFADATRRRDMADTDPRNG